MARNLALAAAALSVGATGAIAGGVERTTQSPAVLFEEGTYGELSFGSFSPSVSGVGTPFSGTPGASSGSKAPSYFQFGLAFKTDFNERLSAALIYDQPFGADVDYPAGTGYFAQGSTAELRSNAVTALLRYEFDGGVSVYGGPRFQTLSAEANVPFIAGYEAEGERDEGFGYVLGVAYEIPDIALRVALTYNSAIEHELDTTESSLAGAGIESVTEINTPQSVNLDFQTGIAPGTLLFGGIRWVEWSEFDITPTVYEGLTGGGSLVSYDDDTITYTLGLGRQLTDEWSVAGSIAYEPSTGGFASNLGPTDGFTRLGLGATYAASEAIDVSFGVTYAFIGDAETTLDGTNAAGVFEDNSGWGGGIRIGYRF